MKKQLKTKYILLAILATFLWGSAYPSIKMGYQIFSIAADDIGSKLLFAGIRFFMAGIFVLIVFAGQNHQFPKIKKGNWHRLLLLGILQTTLQYIFFYIGLAHTTGAKGAIINSFTAFFPILLAPIFFKNDRITKEKILGCLIGLLGIVLINFEGSQMFTFTLLGEGFAVFAAMSQSLASIYSKKLAKNLSVMVITGYQLFFGGTLLIVIGICMRGQLEWIIEGALLLLYMAFISSVAFTVWTYLLSKNPVSQISIYNLLIPIFGTLLSGIFLGEHVFTMMHMLSILCVAFGIIYVNKK